MSAGQVTFPNPVIDSTEDPFNPNSFSDITGRDPETYQVRNDYTEHPGFVGFQLQDRPSITTLRIYNGSDSDDSNDSNIYGTELSIIQTGTPNASQVKVNAANGWCQTHIDNLNMYFIAVYDSRGTNTAFDSVDSRVDQVIGTLVDDAIAEAIAGPIQTAIDTAVDAAVSGGAVADAVQEGVFKHLTRYTYSRDVGDTDHDLLMSGVSPDGTASSIVKQLDATWAKGTNAGGMQSGSSLPTSGVVYVFKIEEDSTGDIDFIGHTSTSPTIPAGWTRASARAFMVLTDSSANIRAFTHGDGVVLLTDTLALDLNVADQGTTRTTRTAVNAPPDVLALRRSHSVCGATHETKVEALAHTDQAAALAAAGLYDHRSDSGFASNAFGAGQSPVYIDSNRQYATDSTQASTSLYVQFYGWFWRPF